MVNTEIRLTIFFADEDGETLYSQQKQDLELTVAQIMSSLLQNSNLKKVGETTRPFRYDLNQISYDYTVEVMNRFKGIDLVHRVPEELWTEVCNTVQEAANTTIPTKKGKKEALQIAEERKEVKSNGERERSVQFSSIQSLSRV